MSKRSTKTEFKSVEELANAVKTIATFFDDLSYARIFEPTWVNSNIFGQDGDRLWDAAKQFDPSLNETADISETLTETCRTSEDQERVFAMVMAIREAYFGIGLLGGARLADPSGLSFNKSSSSIALTAREFLIKLLPDMAPEYLDTEPWDRLVLGLQANGAQLCAECYAVKPLAEFRRPLDLRSKCLACLDVVKLKRANLRNIRKKFRRADAEVSRSTPGARQAARRQIVEIVNGMPGSAAVKRKLLEDQFGIKPRPGDRDLTESC